MAACPLAVRVAAVGKRPVSGAVKGAGAARGRKGALPLLSKMAGNCMLPGCVALGACAAAAWEGKLPTRAIEEGKILSPFGRVLVRFCA